MSGLVLGGLLAKPAEAAWQAVEESAILRDATAVGGEELGESVVVSGSLAFVGAHLESHSGLSEAGAVYLLDRNQGGPGAWGEVARIISSDPKEGDHFGAVVAISGDTFVVGVEPRTSAMTGRVYIFERDAGGPGAWGEVTKVFASASAAGDSFGAAVSIDGDLLAVGAPGVDVGGASNAGAAYLFERNLGGSGAWGEITRVTASAAGAGDSFGDGLAIEGDTLVVGAVGNSHSSFIKPGAAYVFERDAGGPNSWGEVQKLTASALNHQMWFGNAIAMQDDTLMVASWNDKKPGWLGTGSVFAFGRTPGGTTWVEIQKLTASDLVRKGFFGHSLCFEGDRLLVGASGEGMTSGDNPGAAYTFERTAGGSLWTETQKLVHSWPEIGDAFGTAVAFAGSTVLVGSPQDEIGAVVETIDAMAMDTGAGQLVGVDGTPDPEMLINLLPGGGDSTKIGPLGSTKVKGLAFDPGADTFYGTDTGSDELSIIDPRTGAHSPVGALGFSQVRCLAFDPISKILYGVDGATDTLIRIDRTTGAGTGIGTLGLAPNTNIAGLAFDPGAGVLYGSDITFKNIVTINTVTGAGTIVGPVGHAQVSSLAFDTNTDTLFGASKDANEVVAIDTTTGAGVVIGSISVTVHDTGAVYAFDVPLVSETYCTAGTSAIGCQASIGASGTPSATAPAGFDLLVTGVEGQKAGLFFFGVNGRQANTWGGGSSFQCVVPPVARGGLIFAVGTTGSCDASYAYDLNARWAAKPNQNPGAGALVGAQFWYRDTFNPLGPGTSLSDAIEFTVAP